jgi:hypothetical protein
MRHAVDECFSRDVGKDGAQRDAILQALALIEREEQAARIACEAALVRTESAFPDVVSELPTDPADPAVPDTPAKSKALDAPDGIHGLGVFNALAGVDFVVSALTRVSRDPKELMGVAALAASTSTSTSTSRAALVAAMDAAIDADDAGKFALYAMVFRAQHGAVPRGILSDALLKVGEPSAQVIRVLITASLSSPSFVYEMRCTEIESETNGTRPLLAAIVGRTVHMRTLAVMLEYPIVARMAGDADAAGTTPLMAAASAGSTPAVRMLLTCPAAVASAGAVNSRGASALLLAVQQPYNSADRAAAVSALLCCREVIEGFESHDKAAVLWAAALSTDPATVEALLSCPVLARAAGDTSRQSVLATAVCECSARVVRVLLSCNEVAATAGARLGNFLQTALMKAAARGSRVKCEALLSCPAVVASAGCEDAEGRTALTLALSVPKYDADVVETLLACPTIDKTAGGRRNETPLMVAARYGRGVKSLLAYPEVVATVAATDSSKATALIRAAQYNQVGAVMDLLEHPAGRATLHMRDVFGYTAQDIAQLHQNLAMLHWIRIAALKLLEDA